jgi:predicted  nucleic acid-binding Zn-ribbon protein
MKRLNGAVTEQYELEVVECECGYHMGIDSTYLLQVGDMTVECPSCGRFINTEEVCPEE